jgi:hypothetical protein
VRCDVSIGPREGGGFGLTVKLHVSDRSLPQAELLALAQERTRRSAAQPRDAGHVDVQLECDGA